MKIVALLRGVNVGKNRRMDMKKIRHIFESLGYSNVTTYINSGNILFETGKNLPEVEMEVESALKTNFNFDMPVLVKTGTEMKRIANAVPKEWKNDSTQRTDVAYLFKEADSKKSAEDLPVNRDYIDVRYFKGALVWNLKRKYLNKSRLNKIISHRLYQLMTVRNVNTVRYLGSF
jgi:uncharacterized protein (DUF1697 family)